MTDNPFWCAKCKTIYEDRCVCKSKQNHALRDLLAAVDLCEAALENVANEYDKMNIPSYGKMMRDLINVVGGAYTITEHSKLRKRNV